MAYVCCWTSSSIVDWLDCCILDWSNTPPPPPGVAMWPVLLDCRPDEETIKIATIDKLLSLYESLNGNENQFKKFAHSTPMELLNKNALPLNQCLILNTLEYYLSDEFLVRSKFLVSQITRNTQGFISLKLLASFRSLPDIIGEAEQLRQIVFHSTVLRLSKDSLKVKRIIPIPMEIINYHKAIQSRAVKWFLVITNIPNVDCPTLNSFDLVANVIYKMNLIINNIYIHWENESPNTLMNSYMKLRNVTSGNAVFVEIKKNICVRTIYKNWALINTFNMNIDIFTTREIINKNILHYHLHSVRKS